MDCIASFSAKLGVNTDLDVKSMKKHLLALTFHQNELVNCSHEEIEEVMTIMQLFRGFTKKRLK